MQQLTQRHCIAAIMHAAGMSGVEIASACGFSSNYVYTMMQSPLFQAEADRVKQQIRARLVTNASDLLQSETLASVETLIAIRDNQHAAPMVRLRAADSVLDRVTRTSKITKVSQDVSEPVAFSDSQVEYIFEQMQNDPTARQALLAAGAASTERGSLFDTIDIQPQATPEQEQSDDNESYVD